MTDILDEVKAVVHLADREGHAVFGFLHNGAFLKVLEVPLSYIEARAKAVPTVTTAQAAASAAAATPATPPAAT